MDVIKSNLKRLLNSDTNCLNCSDVVTSKQHVRGFISGPVKESVR